MTTTKDSCLIARKRTTIELNIYIRGKPQRDALDQVRQESIFWVRIVLQVPWQVLRPFTNTLSVLAAFKTSMRFSSRCPRALTTRVGQNDASFCCAPRPITVFLELGAQNCVTPKGCLRCQSDSATTHRRICFLKGSKSKSSTTGVGQLGRHSSS